jgi:hypothetical protein
VACAKDSVSPENTSEGRFETACWLEPGASTTHRSHRQLQVAPAVNGLELMRPEVPTFICIPGTVLVFVPAVAPDGRKQVLKIASSVVVTSNSPRAL